MKISELYETPQIIGPLNTDAVNALSKFCVRNVNDAEVIETVTEDVKVYHIKEAQGGVYFLFNNNSYNDKVEYMVRYRVLDFDKSLVPNKSVRQVLVWRNKTSTFSAWFAKDVFWNILFKKYNCIVSDSQQTEKGLDFWVHVISDAFKNKLTVRVIDTNNKTFIDVTSVQDFEKLRNTVWGTKPWFQRKIVAIFDNV